MARAPLEFQIQRAVCIWYGGERFGKNHPRAGEWNVEPAQLPGVVWWHTPNNGKRDDSIDSALEGKWLKQMGVKAGIPDLCFLYGRWHGLELKKKGGSRSPAQRAMHPLLIAAGAFVETVDSLDDAKEQLRHWGLVRPGY